MSRPVASVAIAPFNLSLNAKPAEFLKIEFEVYPTPSPAETPVTRMRLPCRFTPDKTSSGVEVATNTSNMVSLLMPPVRIPYVRIRYLTNGYDFGKTESVSE